MANQTVRVTGYRELLHALQRAEADTRKYVRAEFKHVGEIVQEDAAARFARYDTRSAAGYKVRVRQRGVAVEQSLRRTTGKHPEYGKLQMVKALMPALADKEGEVEARFEEAIDRVAARFAE